jgi:hypothetical protein
MDREQARRVAERTLEVAAYVKGDVEGMAIRFGPRRIGLPYCWREGSSLSNELLDAARGQLAEVLECWELIQGGKSGNTAGIGA